MKRPEWCREEVLRARRGDGVGSVLPKSRLATVGSLVSVAVLVLLSVLALVPVEGGRFLEGKVLAARGTGGTITVAADGVCALEREALPKGAPLGLREKAPFGPWQEWSVASFDGCPDSPRLGLRKIGEAAPLQGTEVLIRIPEPPRPAYVAVVHALRGGSSL